MNLKEIWLFCQQAISSLLKGGANTSVFRPADIITILGDNARYYRTKTSRLSPIIDPVVMDLVELKNYEIVAIARPFSRFYGAKAYGEPIVINGTIFLAKTIDVLLFFFKTSGTYNLGVSFEQKTYERILATVSPKVIMGIEIPKEMIKACEKKRILTIEFLHGRGIEELPPQFRSRSKADLPDLVFCYDNCSKHTFEQLRTKGSEVTRVQHPSKLTTFENWLSKKQNTNYVIERQRSKHVLISTQWGFSGDLSDDLNGIQKMPNGLFSPQLEQAILHSANTIFWHIRLHPVLVTKPGYSKVVKQIQLFCDKVTNAEWKLATELTLTDILKVCDSHITMCSGVVYEASDLGLKSLVLCNSVGSNGNRPNRFNELVSLGFVKKHQASFEQIMEWVMNSNKQQPRETESSVNPAVLIDQRLKKK